MRQAAGMAVAVVAVAGGLVLGPAGAAGASGGSGGSPCVQVRGACYATVQAAVDAAHDGDTVRVPAGQFAGGVIVTKSITLAGAGADRTALVGGEHVLTIGTWMAPSEPTVSIGGLTLRGGRAHSSPESLDFSGTDGVQAGGGGLEIPAAADTYLGATVTVTDSVITDNQAIPVDSQLPTADQESFWPRCPDGFCTFAGARGGGVENWGTLSLVRTTVSNNLAGGPLTSDAEGGGIFSWNGLTLDHSTVTGNTAVAVAPHGRYAEGGGVFMAGGTNLTMHGSSVSGNTASLTSTNPVTNPDGTTTDMLANSGGIHVEDGSTVTIDSSHIDHNLAAVDDPQGSPGVINAALQLTISDLTLTDTTANGNRAAARIKTTDWPMGGALQWCNLGTIRGLSVVGNSTVVTALHGDAAATGAVFAGATECNGFDPGPSTMTDSVIRDNTATAIAPYGDAATAGAGIYVDSQLTMRHVAVTGNRGLGFGRGGNVFGGGIWNGAYPLPFLNGIHSQLTLDHAAVTNNSIGGGPAETLAGGGIYTRDPITFTSTTVTGNNPDQCAGCTGLSAPTATAKTQATTGRHLPDRRGDGTDPLDHPTLRRHH
jgi:hypothetical protein